MDVHLLRRADGEVICERCTVAASPRSRMKGLLGRRELPRGEGLLLRPAGSIHTAFMQFPIDAVFLDRELRVLRVAPELGPWRAAARRRARSVLELPAGECTRRSLRVGDWLQIAVAGGGGRQSAEAEPQPEPADRPAALARGPRVPATAIAIVAAALVAVALARYGIGARGVISAFVAAVLVVLSAIDLERHILPNRIVLPAFLVTLAAQCAFFPDRALEWCGASIGAFAFLLFLHVLTPAGMGMGDVKLALLLGAALGRQVLPAMLIASLCLLPVALAILVRHGRSGRSIPLPFGPFLALGALLVLYLDPV